MALALRATDLARTNDARCASGLVVSESQEGVNLQYTRSINVGSLTHPLWPFGGQDSTYLIGPNLHFIIGVGIQHSVILPRVIVPYVVRGGRGDMRFERNHRLGGVTFVPGCKAACLRSVQ